MLNQGNNEILKQRIATRSGSIAANNIKNFDSIKQMVCVIH